MLKDDRKAEVEATAKAKATASLTPKAETFRRSIKKDPAAYPTLAEEDEWDIWDRKFRATAAIHGLSNVTNAGFRPAGKEAIDLFNEENKFLYNILNSKVTLAEGVTIVRKHEREFDAQEALIELRRFFVESPRAIFKRDELYREITATRMADLNWNGTVTDCVLNWTEKLRKYENGAPDPRMLTTAENKKKYLQAFVDGYHGFEHVRTQENMRQAMGDRVTTYDEYLTLILNEARNLDTKASLNKKSKSKLLTVNQHNWGASPNDDRHDEWDTESPKSTIDSPFDTSPGLSVYMMEIYMTQQRREKAEAKYGPSVSSEAFNSLDPKDKEHWNALSADARRIIVGDLKKSDSPSKESGTPSKKSPPRTANMAMQGNPSPERSVHFLDQVEAESSDEEEDHEGKSTDTVELGDHDDGGTSLSKEEMVLNLFNAMSKDSKSPGKKGPVAKAGAREGKNHPGAVHNMMSTQYSTKKPNEKLKVKAHETITYETPNYAEREIAMISRGSSNDARDRRQTDSGSARDTKKTQRRNTGSIFNFFGSKKNPSGRSKYRINVHEFGHDTTERHDQEGLDNLKTDDQDDDFKTDVQDGDDGDTPKHYDDPLMPPKPTKTVPLYAWTECTFGDDPEVLKNHAWSKCDSEDEEEALDEGGEKNGNPLRLYTTNDRRRI